MTKLADKMRREAEETPDYCYDTEDWETTHEWGDRDMLVDGYDVHDIVEVACLKQMPHKYAVTLAVEWSDEGDPEDWETFWYDTIEEAEAAVADDTYDSWLAEQ